jgi:hypothetical protein
MTNANARHSAWREGYEAALRDLERLAESLRALGAQGSDYRHASHAVEGIHYAVRHLRMKVAGKPGEASHGASHDLPAEVEQREWTEG